MDSTAQRRLLAWACLLAPLLLAAMSFPTHFERIERDGNVLRVRVFGPISQINRLELIENPPPGLEGAWFETEAEFREFLKSAPGCRSLCACSTTGPDGGTDMDLRGLAFAPGNNYWLAGINVYEHTNHPDNPDCTCPPPGTPPSLGIQDAEDITAVVLRGRVFRDNSATWMSLAFFVMVIVWFGAPVVLLVVVAQVMYKLAQRRKDANSPPAPAASGPPERKPGGSWAVHALNPGSRPESD